jgi:hypothetical protein
MTQILHMQKIIFWISRTLTIHMDLIADFL